MQINSSALNPTQIHILKMFNFNQTESSVNKLKQQLFKFYCSEVERIGSHIATSQNLTDEKLEAISNEHNRTK